MADPVSLIANWLTPSSLFIIVNLVIGTIAVTSRFGSAPKNQQLNHQPQQLVRSPSLLQRVRSFNLRNNYNHYEPARAEIHVQPEPEPETEPHQQPELVRTPSLLERVTSFNLSFHKHETTRAETEQVQPEPQGPELVRSASLLQRIKSMNLSRLYRSDSMHRQDPDSSDPGKVEMRKSASERAGSMEREAEEEVERRRPATAREETTTSFEEEVDTKADDFINRFRKQLRLQRIDSLIRYRDMLRRGN